MVFSATINTITVISRRSVLFVEETGVPRENHRSASHWQTLSLHNFVSSTPRHELDSNSQLKVVICTDYNGYPDSCKSNYHAITTAPSININGGVMVSVMVSVVDCGFASATLGSNQRNKTGICCFSARHVALTSEIID
jgi:hypothetical protein